jgi:hypothetical protein
LFPEFVPHIRESAVDASIRQLRDVNREQADRIVGEIPVEWEIGPAIRNGIIDFLVVRAQYVAETIAKLIASKCWPDRFFDTKA